MPLPEDIDALSPAELKLVVVKLLEEVADLRRTVAAQRDEIARLKGSPPRPKIKPNSKSSGMEQATDPKLPGSSNERRRRGSTRAKLTINEERKIKLGARPCGSGFREQIESMDDITDIDDEVRGIVERNWPHPEHNAAVYEYEPDEEEILAELLPRNISVQIFRALMEYAASFYGAQMTAMDSATRNAGEMIRKQTLAYNRTRQAMITKELIEIISGAEAV